MSGGARGREGALRVRSPRGASLVLIKLIFLASIAPKAVCRRFRLSAPDPSGGPPRPFPDRPGATGYPGPLRPSSLASVSVSVPARIASYDGRLVSLFARAVSAAHLVRPSIFVAIPGGRGTVAQHAGADRDVEVQGAREELLARLGPRD
jgi:hypothetical protein